MTRMVPLTQTRFPTNTCVWMDAGLLAYKLCDRGFDCVRCPLDAALRSHPLDAVLDISRDAADGPRGIAFPPDRRYTACHTWIGEPDTGEPRVRLGLDAFAARLIGPPRGVHLAGPGLNSKPGEPVCSIDLPGGGLPIGLPLSGRVVSSNPALEEEPALVRTDPYGSGWLVDWIPDDAEGLDRLPGAAGARRRASLDTKHFCRRAAFGLLERTSAPDGGCFVDLDVRSMLGVRSYLDLLKKLIH